MYYKLDYIEAEKKIFESVAKSPALYSEKILNRLLQLEEMFILDISDKFFIGQENNFPFGVIRDFLEVYPKLHTTLKTKYRIEKEFLVRAFQTEKYLEFADELDIDLFTEYYLKGYNIGGETALKDIKSAMRKGGSDMQKIGGNIKPIFNLSDPIVRDKLKWEAGRRITRINETSKRLIINSLINAYDKGEGYNGMKKEVESLFESWKVSRTKKQWFTAKRAEIIARTELGQSVCWAREESYTRRDVRKKSWLGGPKACPVCVLAMRDGIIAFSKTFSNGFLGPLAHPNCRCCLLPEVEIQDYLKGYTWHGEANNQYHTQI